MRQKISFTTQKDTVIRDKAIKDSVIPTCNDKTQPGR